MALAGTNQYTRFMVEKYDETKKVMAPTAFTGGFFNIPGSGARRVFSENTKSIELDHVRADGNRMARLVHRGTSSDDATRSDVITAEQFTSDAMPWPLIESEGAIDSNQLLNRTAGEQPFNPNETREDRLTRLAMQIHVKAINMQLELHEFLARESILTGQHPMILGTSNTDLIYDFFRKATHTFAAPAKWDVVGTDIIGDLDTAIDLIQVDDFYYGDIGMLVGVDGFEGMRKNTQFKAEADIRRFHFIEMHGPTVPPTVFDRFTANGFKLAGWVKTYSNRTVWIYTYDRTFKDDFTTPGSTTTTKWMPADKALIFNPTARCDEYFGPPDRMPIRAEEIAFYMDTFGFDMNAQLQNVNIENPGVVDPRAFHMDARGSRKAVSLFTQSAPIKPCTEADGFVTITGLV